MKARVYTVYTSCPGGRISTRTADYHSGDWVVEVRATSIKQAYYLVGNRVFAKDTISLGIVGLGRNDRPDARCPWDDGRPKEWAPALN